MIRTMIKMDEKKCNGCGLCVTACHEGAIALVDGVAKLVRDDYCDGLGNCLPVCPTGALSFEDREAAPFDEEAVKRHLAQKEARETAHAPSRPHTLGGCPGNKVHLLPREAPTQSPPPSGATPLPPASHAALFSHSTPVPSQLMQWPVQIKLVPVTAPYFQNAKLLLAADCTAYAYAEFHHRFMKNQVTLIGCPKLDEGDYAEKLTAILRHNEIQNVTIVRMEVPCCGGLEHAAKKALQDCGKMIPWQVHVLSTDGRLLED